MNCLICHSPILSPWAKTCPGKCRAVHDKARKARTRAAKRVPRYCECGVQIYWRQERCKACAKERVKAQWREHAKARREASKRKMPKSDEIIKSIFRKAREINRQLEDEEYEKRFA